MRTTPFPLVLALAAAALAQTGGKPTVIRTETRVVLVDAVVTDRSGKPIRDLTAKDFRVWEDNKEQTIESATFVADPTANPDSQSSYLVLFFDNSTLDYAAQSRARDAAVQFLEANAGPNRMVAVVNYGGQLSITQNFTSDVDRLKRVAAEMEPASTMVRTATLPAMGSAGNAAQSQAVVDAGFGGEGLLIALRRLGTNMAPVPGRKSVILFSAGFPYTANLGSALDSAIEVSNRTNIAIYPVDVTGLLTSNYSTGPGASAGGGGGGRGNRRGGASTADAAAETYQQVLYMLAQHTGGFVYASGNRPVAGLVKIGREQTEHYLLGYSPADSPEGSCHTLRVKTDRAGAAVRARASYCNVKAVDLLSGKPAEKSLEDRVAGDAPGSVTASMQVPFFYTEPDTARLDVAIEIPSDSVQFEKVKGKSHAEVNILGIAYKPNGTVGARFSDTVKLDLASQKEMSAFRAQPLHYEKQFFVAPGKYELKVAFSSGGGSFGKLAVPLDIDPYDGKQFMLSGLALSKEIRPAIDAGTQQDAELLEGLTPLIFKDLRVVPAGSNQFRKTDAAAIYAEVYEPLLKGAAPPAVALVLKVIDKKTGEVKSTGISKGDPAEATGGAITPFAIKVRLDALAPGWYRAEVQALDSAEKSMTRSVEFQVQ